MKQLSKSNYSLPLLFLTATLVYFPSSQAQKKKKDDLFVLQEYVKLWQIYEKPIQLSIHIQNSALPVSKEADTSATDVDYYISNSAFYFQAEGLEQIVNDSLIIMVNHPVKQISIYRNYQPVKKSVDKFLSTFWPESSIEQVARDYSSVLMNERGNKGRIELQSKATVFGTTQPKEKIEIIYIQKEYLPVELLQKKRSLIPIDSVSYSVLLHDPNFAGKLISNNTEKANLFFILKELKTLYSFKKIQVNVPHPPVQQQDRIIKDRSGNYVPSERYNEYIVSIEF